MSRPNLLGASAVIASASLILMLALLVTQGVAAGAPTSPPTAARSISGPTVIAPEDPNCFAWDFANYTGADVDGLTLRLQGNHSVSAVYTETLNPFFGLDTGYEGGTDSYRLVFTDGLTYDSDLVHVGLCTDPVSRPIEHCAEHARLDAGHFHSTACAADGRRRIELAQC